MNERRRSFISDKEGLCIACGEVHALQMGFVEPETESGLYFICHKTNKTIIAVNSME